MLKNKHFQKLARPKHFLITTIGIATAVVSASLLLFVTMFGVKQEQDIRNQATGGPIPIRPRISFTLPSDAKVETSSSFDINVNTGSVTTTAVQIKVTVDTTKTGTLALADGDTGLELAVKKVEKSGNQTIITIIAIPQTATGSFATNETFKRLARLSFTPTTAGSVSITTDNSYTKMFEIGSDGTFDLLADVGVQNFSIAEKTTNPPVCTAETKTCPDGREVGRDPNNNCEFHACQPPNACTTELKECPDGKTVVGRNLQNNCEFHSCPGSVCRPDQKTCADGSVVNRDPNNSCEFRACPTPPLVCNNQLKTCPDNSTVGRNPNNNCEFHACPSNNSGGTGGATLSSCNQYCASSNDCSSSLVCWYNQCRNPLNVESPSCANRTVAQNQAVLSSCNQGCASHRDCATSLVCYKGACRAATNPVSTSCNPVPAPTPTPTPAGKGSGKATPTPTPKATATPAPTATASAVILTPAPSASPDSLFEEPVNESALGAVQQYLADFWKNGDRTQVMVVFGLAILMVIGLIALLVSLLSPRRPTPPTHRTPPPTMPPPTLTMQQR
ncbi:MAG: hypothetical protein O2840_03330 [bacterium]|nr:hypothetical protein [bacterium]